MPEYAGSELSYLPYESAFSQVARIVTLNEMTASQFLRLAGRKEGDREWDVSNSRLLQLDGFQRCLPDSEMFEKVYDIFDMRFCSSSLRVCDQCIGSMYHSLWHQCWIVRTCPVHGCQLRTVCPFCKKPYGNCTFSQAVRHRFSCRRCGNSLSMEPATIVRHLAFRNVAAQLDVAFVTFYRQLRRLSVLSQRLSHLEKLFPFKMVNKWWPEGRSYWDVTRDVGLAHEKKPQSSPEMTWLVWPSSHQPEFRDRSEFNLAYDWTIDSLKRWLMQSNPRLADAGERPELFDERGFPRTDLWPPEFLAFMLLRYHVEEDAPSWGLRTSTAGIRRASNQLACHTWFNNNNWPRGCARVEWVQAMAYGRFAALYWAAKYGVLADRKFEGDDYVVPCFWSNRAWEPDIAAVVFPTIDGMPLGRFDPSPLRLKDAVEIMYRDGVSRQRESLVARRAELGRQSFPPVSQGT
ncbi:hypothetical protein SAMN05444172_2249 [Burkholderia sp. GAS332]|nr:hypothetical protein SAMN05444172_2249 [Burkholderia sp. GAS332]